MTKTKRKCEAIPRYRDGERVGDGCPNFAKFMRGGLLVCRKHRTQGGREWIARRR
jgi:hypothetical protein